MTLKDLTINELETMPYDEIAYMILFEGGKKQKLLNLYKKICTLLKLDFEIEQEKIAEFFEVLSTNKKFVMLDNGYWDLQTNHKPDHKIEESEDDLIDEEESEEVEIEEDATEEEDIFYDNPDNEDVIEDDLKDLVVVDEDGEMDER